MRTQLTDDLDRIAHWGNRLTVLPPGGGLRAVPLQGLLETDLLEIILQRYARRLGTDALEVAASSWSKEHAKTVLPGTLASWVRTGAGIDLSPENVHLHVQEDAPHRLRFLDPQRLARGEEGWILLRRTLFAEHIAPLYERLHEISGLGVHVLWGNAGNLIAWLLNRLAEEERGPRLEALSSALLNRSSSCWGDGKNPLQEPVRPETVRLSVGLRHVHVRRTCCLRLSLPGKAACTSCPLLTRAVRRKALLDLECRA